MRAVLFLLLLCASVVVYAQDSTASVSGTVQDIHDHPVANARITLTVSDSSIFYTNSASDGSYSFMNLRPGDYRMETSWLDFYITVQFLHLEAGKPFYLNPQLFIDQPLIMSGPHPAPVIDRSNTTSGTHFDAGQVRRYPVR